MFLTGATKVLLRRLPSPIIIADRSSFCLKIKANATKALQIRFQPVTKSACMFPSGSPASRAKLLMVLRIIFAVSSCLRLRPIQSCRTYALHELRENTARCHFRQTRATSSMPEAVEPASSADARLPQWLFGNVTARRPRRLRYRFRHWQPPYGHFLPSL